MIKKLHDHKRAKRLFTIALTLGIIGTIIAMGTIGSLDIYQMGLIEAATKLLISITCIKAAYCLGLHAYEIMQSHN